MTIKITKTNNTSIDGISMLLYGVSNSGKTHAAGTLPEGETLFLDSEKSTTTLHKKSHDVIHFNYRTYQGKDGFSLLRDDIFSAWQECIKYQNIVIDTLSELESLLVMSMAGEMGMDFPRLKEYGQGAIYIRKIIRLFRALTLKGINIIFVANERIIEKARDQNKTKVIVAPEFTQSLAVSCAKMFDLVGRIQLNPNTGVRKIRFDGSDSTFIARSRFSLGPFEDPDLPTLFKKCKDREEEKDATPK